MRTLVAIPVYNEAKYVRAVLRRVLAIHSDVLVIDDGSNDGTASALNEYPIDLIRHRANRGYGRSLSDAFAFSIREKYDWLITMDCDEQHEPAAIPRFIDDADRGGADIISGSRYLLPFAGDDRPPPERRAINAAITSEINARLASGLGTLLTDSFCGFKAYRVRALRRLRPTVNGYAFPMQFWVQAAAAGLKVRELPVRLIYNDPMRTFGGHLDNAQRRLNHYRLVLHREIRRRADQLPISAGRGLCDANSGCCPSGDTECCGS
ncbi:MAG: glycosyltransferase family 2 protein [Phycisphaerae bacterium]|nr:glycosyltransferase family 2 protein [Phycisphaerae bacterium]